MEVAGFIACVVATILLVVVVPGFFISRAEAFDNITRSVLAGHHEHAKILLVRHRFWLFPSEKEHFEEMMDTVERERGA